MQSSFDFDDLSDKRVLISLSGGINSAAVLCYVACNYAKERRPANIWLYYAHLEEHSPDTLDFVMACMEYAGKHFENVVSKIHFAGSVLAYFENKHMIPHPILSPCSEDLKFGPMAKWADENKIDIDLIGFVRGERARIMRQQKRKVQGKLYPIAHLTEADCFELVDREIGWHPAIYDIKGDGGKRVFRHNNCLPCKNMSGNLDACNPATGQFADVEAHFPEQAKAARELAARMGAYWGRAGEFTGYCKLCED